MSRISSESYYSSQWTILRGFFSPFEPRDWDSPRSTSWCQCKRVHCIQRSVRTSQTVEAVPWGSKRHVVLQSDSTGATAHQTVNVWSKYYSIQHCVTSKNAIALLQPLEPATWLSVGINIDVVTGVINAKCKREHFWQWLQSGCLGRFTKAMHFASYQKTITAEQPAW